MRAAAPILPVLGPSRAGRLTRDAGLILAGTAILALSARITVPMWPVEMSLQSLAVLLIGATLGLRLGLATVLAYLAEGAAGLPVFQGTPELGIGLAYMAGPTGGYLAGFVAMAAIAGWAADRGWWRDPLRMGAAMLAGAVVLLGLGALWLSVLLGTEKAVALGVVPFVVPELVKVGLAACLVKGLGHAAGRLSGRD